MSLSIGQLKKLIADLNALTPEERQAILSLIRRLRSLEPERLQRVEAEADALLEETTSPG